MFFLKDLMPLLTGKLKVSKATPSGNNNTRNHCHQYLQELKHSLASYPCSIYRSAELHIVTLGLILCLSEMTWATHLWVALPGMNNPRFLLNHHVFFPFIHHIFFNSTTASQSPWLFSMTTDKEKQWENISAILTLQDFPVLYRPPFMSSFQRK